MSETRLIWIVLLCSIWCAVATAQNETLAKTEVQALQSLYIATDGPNWKWKPVDDAGSIWNFTTTADPCSEHWQGVTCSDMVSGEDRRVLDLQLVEYGLYGTLPEAIGNLTHLEILILHVNRLHGPIPDSPWATMPNLSILALGENRLTGTIPASIGQLAQLSTLSLNINKLNGSIPDSLGNATALTTLYLDNNRLSGQIPSSLGQLTQLTELILAINHLTGTLPSSLAQLGSLSVFGIGYNSLHETIPTFLQQLTNLTILSLQANTFSGTVPTALCALHKLELLWVDKSAITGTIPPCLGELTGLIDLQLNTNNLHGTIPSTLCNITGIEALYVGYNTLTGTIPECFGTLQKLHYLGIQANHVGGTIPPAIAVLPHMETIWFRDNYLTGTLPDLGVLYNLTQMYVGNNHMTGTIPDCFAKLTKMQILNVSLNHFTGPFPASVGDMFLSELVSFDHNLLTGSIPATLQRLGKVRQLYLNDNHLSGSLDGVFNATTQFVLLDVFLNDNQLTGSLPDDLFLLPKLNTIVAQGNCFTGTLSAAMCESPAMVSLILDGLHTSPACRRSLVSKTHSYMTGSDVHGTIPPCLFSMPFLVSLHLAGNSLTGPLPDISKIGSAMTFLTASHNSLTGTIPLSVQSHEWHVLDLSYNRLSGSLQNDFGTLFASSTTTIKNVNVTYNATAVSLSVQNNRLSGKLPSPLVHVEDVSVLGSNMFACKIDKSDLPKHDSDRNNYQCGSDAFNGPFYVVIVLLALALIAWVLTTFRARWTSVLIAQLQSWQLALAPVSRSVRYVLNMSDVLCKIGLWCTALIVVVLVPWYAAASYYYGTYTHQYAWVVSAGFLSGLTPAVTEFFLYCAILCIVATAAVQMNRLMTAQDTAGSTTAPAKVVREPSSAPGVDMTWSQRVSVYLLFLTVNIFVVGGVNAGFVAITLTQSDAVLVLAQILLSVFKLLWGTVGAPRLLTRISGWFSPSDEAFNASLVTVQVFVGLFNNIAIPCLVVAVLSPSCFNGVFDAAPSVSSSYFVQYCYVTARVVVCTYRKEVFLTSTFSPPFRYDYQCSSSFITYYAPAFVYLGLAAGVGAPLVSLLGLRLLQRAAPGSWRHLTLTRSVPHLLAPELEVRSNASTAPSAAAERTPVFNASNHFVALITYLGILLTFGVVFPPLAVVMCATMLSVAWRTKLSIGRFLHFAREQSAPQLAEAIDRDCKGAVSLLTVRNSMFVILCFSACVYAVFLFDTLGDAVGLSGAYWVLIVMPLFPILLYAALRLRRHCAGDPNESPEEVTEEDAPCRCTMELQHRSESGDGAIAAGGAAGGASGVTFNAMLKL